MMSLAVQYSPPSPGGQAPPDVGIVGKALVKLHPQAYSPPTGRIDPEGPEHIMGFPPPSLPPPEG
jgi:hypothetical protein